MGKLINEKQEEDVRIKSTNEKQEENIMGKLINEKQEENVMAESANAKFEERKENVKNILIEMNSMPEDQPFLKPKENLNSLIKGCVDYSETYAASKCVYSAQRVLLHYVKDEPALTITDKLNIEFVLNKYRVAHGSKSETKFFKEFVDSADSEKNLQKFLDEALPTVSNTSLENQNSEAIETIQRFKEDISGSFKQWKSEILGNDSSILSVKGLKLDNLHNAIADFKIGLNPPKKDLIECVAEVLTNETLEWILCDLKNKNSIRLYFMSRPIIRALKTDSIKSYTPIKGNKTVYFNERYEKNLRTLKEELSERKETLMEAYNEYIEITNEIKMVEDICKELC